MRNCVIHPGLLSVLIPALLLTARLPSPAQQLSTIPRQDFWVTDGAVNAIAVTNDRVFIGGNFRYVGPYTGGGVPVDVTTMQPVAKYPKVNGSVHAVEPDGQGGWFIGGLFTTVGGWPRTNLAHITAAGNVNTNWVAHATGGLGRVTKLALDQDLLYVVGEFTHLGGLPRHRLGAVLTAGGAVTSWAPQVETNVLAIAVSPSAVYLGGRFLTLNGAERRYVGAVDKTTGETTPWNPWDPDVNPIIYHNFLTNSYPQALVVANGWVIFPGRFNGGFEWVNLAAFRESDGSVVWGRGGAEIITDLKVRDDKLYVAGRFTSIGGDGTAGAVSRTNLAAIELVLEGRVTDWVPAYAGVEQSLAFHGNSVFAVGWFENPNPWAGNGVRTNANHLVRLDMETGATLEPFRPLNDGPIWAVAAQGDRLFLGGGFTSLGGVSHEYLAELDGRDGSLQPWIPQPSSSVSALTLADGRLYVGGWFDELGGTSRQQVGAYDLNGPTLLDWNPGVERNTATFGSHPVSELVPLGDALLVAGEFQAVGGQPRTNLALLNRATGEVLDWRADADGHVAAVALAAGHLYVAGAFSKIGGVERRHLARLNPGSAAVEAWDPGPDARVTSLSANSSALYLSGFFTKIGETPRAGLAAFDLATGALLPWNLDQDVLFPFGWPLLALEDTVYAAGVFRINGASETLQAVHPQTAEPAAWRQSPYHPGFPLRLLHDGRRLLITARRDIFYGPTRGGITVYEPPGFSQFTQLTPTEAGTRLRLAADQGRAFIIERTTDFGDWTGVSTNVAWEGLLEVEDPATPAEGPVFYRAKTTH